VHIFPKARVEFRVQEGLEDLSERVSEDLKSVGVVIQQHLHGSRVVGTVFRPMAWGQQVRVDLRSLDANHSDVIVEASFPFPWIDFTHENQKTLDIVQGLFQRHPRSSSAASEPVARSAEA